MNRTVCIPEIPPSRDDHHGRTMNEEDYSEISEESSSLVPVGVVPIVKMKTIRNYVSSEHPTTSRRDGVPRST